MSRKKGMKHYLLATKLEAIRLFEEEGKAHKEITELLGLRDPKRIQKWLQAYRREGEEAFQKNSKRRKSGRPPKRENTKAYIARLEVENELLQDLNTITTRDA